MVVFVIDIAEGSSVNDGHCGGLTTPSICCGAPSLKLKADATILSSEE